MAAMSSAAEPVLAPDIRVFHLQGQHDQKTHGRRRGPNVYDEDMIRDAFEASDIRVNDDVVARWQVDSTEEYGDDRIVYGSVYASFYGQREVSVGDFTRTLSPDGGVYNDGLHIRPSFQNNGIGTAFLDYTERHLANAGFDYVNVDAVNVGRYAWAARGYRLNEFDVPVVAPRWMMLARVQADEFGIPQGWVDAIEDAWDRDPNAVYGSDIIALAPDKNWSAVFLEGPTWSGRRSIVHLRDREDLSVEVFHLRGTANDHDQSTHARNSAGRSLQQVGKDSAEERAAVDNPAEWFVSDDEFAAARALADDKARNVPKPTREQIRKNKRSLRNSKRPGGELRGNSYTRRDRAEALFAEFGGVDRGYCPCSHCGIKVAPKARGGYARMQQDKILTVHEGGTYGTAKSGFPNLIPSCGGCNSSRNDAPYPVRPVWEQDELPLAASAGASVEDHGTASGMVVGWDDPELDAPTTPISGTYVTRRVDTFWGGYIQHLIDGETVDPATVEALVAHGSHNQKDHGNWARGGGLPAPDGSPLKELDDPPFAMSAKRYAENRFDWRYMPIDPVIPEISVGRRATMMIQGTYETNQAVLDAARNLRDGRPVMDGIRPPTAPWGEGWTDEDGGPQGQPLDEPDRWGYSTQDMSNDVASAAEWINARKVDPTGTLYRGMTFDHDRLDLTRLGTPGGDVHEQIAAHFAPGTEFEFDYTSASPKESIAKLYSKSDHHGHRPAGRAVMMKIEGTSGVQLPQFGRMDESPEVILREGRGRVTSVRPITMKVTDYVDGVPRQFDKPTGGVEVTVEYIPVEVEFPIAATAAAPISDLLEQPQHDWGPDGLVVPPTWITEPGVETFHLKGTEHDHDQSTHAGGAAAAKPKLAVGRYYPASTYPTYTHDDDIVRATTRWASPGALGGRVFNDRGELPYVEMTEAANRAERGLPIKATAAAADGVGLLKGMPDYPKTEGAHYRATRSLDPERGIAALVSATPDFDTAMVYLNDFHGGRGGGVMIRFEPGATHQAAYGGSNFQFEESIISGEFDFREVPESELTEQELYGLYDLNSGARTPVWSATYRGPVEIPDRDELAVEQFHLQGQHDQKTHGNWAKGATTGTMRSDLVGLDGHVRHGVQWESDMSSGYGDLIVTPYQFSDDTGVYKFTYTDQRADSLAVMQNPLFDVRLVEDDALGVIGLEVELKSNERVRFIYEGRQALAEFAKRNDIRIRFVDDASAHLRHGVNEDGTPIDRPSSSGRVFDEVAAYDTIHDTYNQMFTAKNGREYLMVADPTVDSAGGGRASGWIEDYETGRVVADFDRQVDLEGGFVMNDSFKVRPEYQGLGIGTAFLDASESSLRDAGITDADVTAISVGRYAWAARGYKVGSPSGAAAAAQNWLSIADDKIGSYDLTDVQRSQYNALSTAWRSGQVDVYGSDLLAIDGRFRDVFLDDRADTWSGTLDLTGADRTRVFVDPNQPELDLAVQVFHLQGRHDQKSHGNRGGGRRVVDYQRHTSIDGKGGYFDIRPRHDGFIARWFDDVEEDDRRRPHRPALDVHLRVDDDGNVVEANASWYNGDSIHDDFGNPVTDEQADAENRARQALEDHFGDITYGPPESVRAPQLGEEGYQPKTALAAAYTGIEFTDDLGGKYTIELLNEDDWGLNDDDPDAGPGEGFVSGRLIDENGNIVGKFEREFDGYTIQNSSFSVVPNARGRGIGTGFLNATEEAMADYGAQYVKLTAVDIGRYAWAARGYRYTGGYGAPEYWIDHAYNLAYDAGDIDKADRFAALGQAWNDDPYNVFPGDLITIDKDIAQDALLFGDQWYGEKYISDTEPPDPSSRFAVDGIQVFHLQGQHDQKTHGNRGGAHGSPHPDRAGYTRFDPVIQGKAVFRSKRPVFRSIQQIGNGTRRAYMVETEHGPVEMIDTSLPDEGRGIGVQSQMDMINAVADVYERFPIRDRPQLFVDRNFRRPHSVAWVGSDHPGRIYVSPEDTPGWVDPTLPADEAWAAGSDFVMPVAAGRNVAEYIAVHEYGHSWTFDAVDNVARHWIDSGQILRDLGDDLPTLSKYGQSNGWEAIAESFTEYALSNGETTNPAVRRIAQWYGWDDELAVAAAAGPPTFGPTVDSRIVIIDTFNPAVPPSAVYDEQDAAGYEEAQMGQIGQETATGAAWDDSVTVFHLQGEHDQKTHGNRGGSLTLEGFARVYDGRKFTAADGFEYTVHVGPTRTLDNGSHRVEGLIRDRANQQAGFFGRSLSPDGTQLHNDYFEVEAAFQNEGIGTAFLDHTEAALVREHGVRLIHLTATDVGRYAWAARGYTSSNTHGEVDVWSDQVWSMDLGGDQRREALSVVQEWRDALDRGDVVYPADMLTVAPQFRDVLLEGPDWDASKKVEPLTYRHVDREDLASTDTATFHLRGQHDQKTHGNRGGGRFGHDGFIEDAKRPRGYFGNGTDGYSRDLHRIDGNPTETFRLAKPPVVDVVKTVETVQIHNEHEGETWTEDEQWNVWKTADGKVTIVAQAEDFQWALENGDAEGFGPVEYGAPVDEAGLIQMIASHAEMARVAAGLDTVDIRIPNYVPPQYQSTSGWVTLDEPGVINLVLSRQQRSADENARMMPDLAERMMASQTMSHDLAFTTVHEVAHIAQIADGRLGWANLDDKRIIPPDSYSPWEIGGPVNSQDHIDSEWMSEYGRTSWWEAEAEAFAEWTMTGGTTNNPAVQEYATRVGWGDRTLTRIIDPILRPDEPLAATAGPGPDRPDGVIVEGTRPAIVVNGERRELYADDPAEKLAAGQPVTVAAITAPDIVATIGAGDRDVVDLTKLSIDGHPYLFAGVPALARRTRDQMPQIPSELLDTFATYLDDMGIGAAPEVIDPVHLQSTQSDLNAAKTGQMVTALLADEFEAEHAMWVAADGFILDGHHRWAAAAVLSAAGRAHPPLKVLRVDVGIDALLMVAEMFCTSHGIGRKTIAMGLEQLHLQGQHDQKTHGNRGVGLVAFGRPMGDDTSGLAAMVFDPPEEVAAAVRGGGWEDIRDAVEEHYGSDADFWMTEADYPKVLQQRAAVAKNAEKIAETLSMARKVPLDEAVETTLAEARQVLDDADLSMRVGPSALEGILADGEFKTQFETGTSAGMLHAGLRDAHEFRAFGYEPVYGENGDELYDPAAWGDAAPGTRPEDRPVYGYIALDDGPGIQDNRDTLGQYGRIQVVFNDDVKDRATFTLSDSMNEYALPSPIRDPRLESMTAFTPDGIVRERTLWDDGVPWKEATEFQYIEAQMHGHIGIEDVREIIVGPYETISPALAEALDRSGVPWKQISR